MYLWQLSSFAPNRTSGSTGLGQLQQHTEDTEAEANAE